MKKNFWAIGFTAALLAFSAYLMLDTFVLRTSYSSAGEANTALFAELTAGSEENSAQPSNGSLVLRSHRSDKSNASRSRGKSDSNASNNGDKAETGADSASTFAQTEEMDYQDENISITLTEYVQNDTSIYAADVELSSAYYLKTAFANDTYGKNVTETTSSMAQDKDAILAINGDYYGVQEKGYVIRNGVVYRNTAKGADVLCIFADGTMDIVSDREFTAEELVDCGVWQAFSFGPALIENGTISVSVNEEVGRAMASNPRTAIGLIDTNHFVFVVSDGRTDESEGLSLYELAAFLQSLGVKTAYNLDGGGSSTMVFHGQLVNNPTAGGSIKERGVSDIVYIG